MSDEMEDLKSTADLVGKLAALRDTYGISQRKMAEATGVSTFTISRIEKLQSDPTISQLQRYARAVNTRILFKTNP